MVHIASGDLWAGAEVMLFNLLRAQQRIETLQPCLIALNEGELTRRAREAGVAVSVISESSYNGLQLIRKCRSELLRITPQIIHTHRIKEDVLGSVASIGIKGARVIRTVHGVDEAQMRTRTLARRLSRILHRTCVRLRVARTVAVSESMRRELASRFPRRVVAYVANGIEIPTLRDSKPKPRRPVCVGFVGRLVPVKRVDIFLRAAAILNERAPGIFVFKIFGDGPEESALRALAAELNLLGNVAFEGFVLNIAETIAALDMLLLTSDSEGLPMVILEAMALGVPVVASAVGEIPEVLANGGCGELIRTREPAEFAAALARYAESREPFLERAAAASARVRQRYSSDACARAYLDQYLACLEVE